ncbi:MAG: hypothetical protein HYU31_02810 [Deltaproteobacteria bacterium]|nr:hypothetical protein [Deltaproteobacteria bacterium]MBI2228954.1 hypothetical protein [Deltaproteobacteria bacterium]MBI2366689.1 hypothetical protein [Deltaproteobacteria bacterium]MBI2531318.1 hypothetical protein [Deltaproteobacteria bacterium]
MKHAKLRLRVVHALSGLALLLACLTESPFAAEQPYYAGKTIRIIAGFSPGGTVDIRARLLARHLPKWIPGNPSVIVQNMTGAGGQIAANYVFGVAKPDGLTVLHFPNSAIVNTYMEPASVKYDIRQVPIVWVGADSWTAVVNPKVAKIRKAEDILRAPVKLRVGGTGLTSMRSLRPKLALELFGVDHTWVTGYGGSADLLVALEKGEIHLFEDPQDGYKRNVQPREKEGTAAVLWQTGTLTLDETFKRSELLPHVPTLDEVLPKDKKTGPPWEAWKAAVAPQSFQYAIGVTPGVPSDRITILSQALEKMTQDPEFRQEFEKSLGEPPDALIGEKADRVVKDAVKKLLEDYQAGVRYLQALAKKN